MATRIKVNAGERHGRLTVIQEAKPRIRPCGRKRRMVTCTCDCGTTRVVRLSHLRSGSSTSCGCTRDETFTGFKHGYCSTPTYSSWHEMLRRCREPQNKNYVNYGGRGIAVCARWVKFENFLEDMGERPDGRTLDRLDNNGNYEPDNCRWATWPEQQRNKRTSVLLTYQGVTQCLSDWADSIGMSVDALRRRIHRGWSVADALTLPRYARRSCHAR